MAFARAINRFLFYRIAISVKIEFGKVLVEGGSPLGRALFTEKLAPWAT